METDTNADQRPLMSDREWQQFINPMLLMNNPIPSPMPTPTRTKQRLVPGSGMGSGMATNRNDYQSGSGSGNGNESTGNNMAKPSQPQFNLLSTNSNYQDPTLTTTPNLGNNGMSNNSSVSMGVTQPGITEGLQLDSGLLDFNFSDFDFDATVESLGLGDIFGQGQSSTNLGTTYTAPTSVGTLTPGMNSKMQNMNFTDNNAAQFMGSEMTTAPVQATATPVAQTQVSNLVYGNGNSNMPHLQGQQRSYQQGMNTTTNNNAPCQKANPSPSASASTSYMPANLTIEQFLARQGQQQQQMRYQ
ncbi:hypothetical protein F5Y17DRAFT_459531 [Xylariaceae sp. FL0594]|nr:hypothetical protein F5Y17DRAFT_459531 [Xylariaceae sp. FL0594]